MKLHVRFNPMPTVPCAERQPSPMETVRQRKSLDLDDVAGPFKFGELIG
jgi:hypothetical protein